MGMGFLPYWMMYECLMATFLFYLAHWQTYVTGNIFLKLPQLKKILTQSSAKNEPLAQNE